MKDGKKTISENIDDQKLDIRAKFKTVAKAVNNSLLAYQENPEGYCRSFCQISKGLPVNYVEEFFLKDMNSRILGK